MLRKLRLPRKTKKALRKYWNDRTTGEHARVWSYHQWDNRLTYASLFRD